MFLQQVNKGRSEFGYFILTFLLIVFGYFIGGLPIDAAISFAAKKHNDVNDQTIQEFYSGNTDFSIFHIDKNIGLILMICIFLGVWLALYVGMKYFHQRKFKELITTKNNIDFKKIIFAFGLWLLISIAFESIFYLIDPSQYYFNFKPAKFIVLILICLFILPIQTTAEELVFRGYLLQYLTKYFKAPWVALLVSSLLFGLIHGQNPEIDKYGTAPMMTYYITAGLFLAFLTIFDDGLELAIGVHFATNFFGASIISYEGSVLQTDTLYKSTDIDPWMANLALFVGAIIFTLICAKKYKWSDIKNLLSKIDTTSYHGA